MRIDGSFTVKFNNPEVLEAYLSGAREAYRREIALFRRAIGKRRWRRLRGKTRKATQQ